MNGVRGSVSFEGTALGRFELTDTDPTDEGRRQLCMDRLGPFGDIVTYAYVTAAEAHEIAESWARLAVEIAERKPELVRP